jgi:Tfp pilus assembly protein PilN
MTLPRLQIDYVVTPRRARWSGYLLLAVALALAGHSVVRYQAVQLELGRIQTAKDMLNVERRAPQPIPKARLDEQLKNAETVVRQLALPWAVLVQTLEEAAINEVAILQLQPEAQQRLLKITAEARTNDAMLEYLRRLAAAKTLSGVHLLSHQVQTEDPQQPIQFSVQARFKAAP